ncbi:SIMPL domain-containing protein [Deinococcus roseus]|uniref:SIMPL domain-containing protein n=1 Tax=Deinococcus roseus TaxID=392414 RepID=A0ABQ2D733_9DEIO|nr:SIMPL domain-containing protein [Deinococcus roseus]GGJ45850.1 SIMPL domain-containing protein [Deinococcus roseus]
MKQDSPQLLVGLLLLSIALVVCAYIGVSGFRDIKKADDIITVTGSTKKDITSNYVIWDFSISNQGTDLQALYSELSTSIKAVDAFLKTQNLPTEELVQDAVSTEPTTFYNKDANGQDISVAGYILHKHYQLRSSDVKKIVSINQAASSLISRGIPLVSSPLQYLYTDLPTLRMNLLEEATKDAKERAMAMVKSTGSQLGAMKSARMGVFQITPRFTTQVDDYGSYDTTSLEKDVTAVVTVSFAVQ